MCRAAPSGKTAADTGYGSAENLAWLVHERGIEPHIPVFEESSRSGGTFSRFDFTCDHKRDVHMCPAGKQLMHDRRAFSTPCVGVDEHGLMRYRASSADCRACALEARCCPTQPRRNVQR